MTALTLTPDQLAYLKAAVRRDLENLEEMAPWDIDDQTDQWKADVATCKAVIQALEEMEVSDD